VAEVTGKDTLEALAAGSPAAARMFQVSLRHPESVLLELLRRAADAGYSSACLRA
jgi:hypothetical protein